MRVLVAGTFDDLHPGHLYFLSEAQKRGELHVIVARDVSVERIKGRPPLQSMFQRMRAIHDAFPEAKVYEGSTGSFLEPVLAIKPDLLILGYDQKLPPGMNENDLPCDIDRLGSFEPHIHKSSLRRGQKPNSKSQVG